MAAWTLAVLLAKSSLVPPFPIPEGSDRSRKSSKHRCSVLQIFFVGGFIPLFLRSTIVHWPLAAALAYVAFFFSPPPAAFDGGGGGGGGAEAAAAVGGGPASRRCGRFVVVGTAGGGGGRLAAARLAGGGTDGGGGGHGCGGCGWPCRGGCDCIHRHVII